MAANQFIFQDKYLGRLSILCQANLPVVFPLLSYLGSLKITGEFWLHNRDGFRVKRPLSGQPIYFRFPIVIPVTRNNQIRDVRRF